MKKRSFEDELEYSKEILDKLISPDITLSESLKLYEEGIKSIKKAQKMIEDAKLKIEKISNKIESEEI